MTPILTTMNPIHIIDGSLSEIPSLHSPAVTIEINRRRQQAALVHGQASWPRTRESSERNKVLVARRLCDSQDGLEWP